MKELIVITGATSGIGEACAKKFSDAGYPLLLLGRRIERLENLQLPNALCKQVDVTNLVSFTAAVREAEKKFGPTGCIINNAGVLHLGQLVDQDPEEWKKMLDVNVLGVLYGIKIVLKAMMARRSGTIINISSIAGVKNYPHHDVYCATKFGVHALTEGLRQEIAEHNVRCITISPGVVETEVLDHTTSDKLRDNYNAGKASIEKTIESDEMADIILFTYQLPQHICIRDLQVCPTGQTQ